MFAMSQVFHEVELAGQAIEDSSLMVLSLSITIHITRLGRYEPDSRQRPAVLGTRSSPAQFRRDSCVCQRLPRNQHVMFCGESRYESLPDPNMVKI